MSIWDERDLEERILPGLSRVDGNLREKILEIAANETPEATFGMVEEHLHNRGFVPREGVVIARAASWLAVAKRENKGWFDHIVAKLSS